MNKEEDIIRVRKFYENITSKNWGVKPIAHGEKMFASWDYQLWLERKVLEMMNKSFATKEKF